jgi:NAD(P)-dependent dehydrogenase (short-subunit alcohol dehydrogenase family)
LKLKNTNIIVTGSSQGFGKILAQTFVDNGANVFMCARNSELLEQARSEIAATAKGGQQVLAQTCDVSEPAQVEQLIEAAINQLGDIHVLVNNAGVYGPLGLIEDVDWIKWAKAVEINLYGVVLPSRAILPHFKARGSGKIITLSGGGATSPLPRISAYAASKAAVVRFIETLALEVKDDGIDVNAIAPGALNTRLLDEVIEAGPEKVGEKFHQRMLAIKAKGGAPMDKGAALCVFLSSKESNGVTGKLISAIWDDWADLPNHMDDLESDVYTLRRIIPNERGMTWGEVD